MSAGDRTVVTDEDTTRTGDGYATDRVADERRGPVAGRQRAYERFGGLNWGAAFFGWLVAVGLGALLTAFLSAAGAAIGLSKDNAETLGLVGGIGLIVIALISYFAGGYVAGRMSRFDGGRQGFGVWAWAVIIAIVLAILGAIAGSEYNLFGDLSLPRIPIDEGTLGIGGLITLVAMVLGSLLAAIAGGKAGESYHRRVDAAAAGTSGRRVAPATADRDY
jgi:hypothetical protein